MAQDVLARVRDGMAEVQVDEPIRQAALANVERWLSEPQFRDYVPQIEALVARREWNVLVDSFYQVIPFGTGGRRGAVGVGPNRINPYTIASSVQGHADYLKAIFPHEQDDLSVVIAWDVRRFEDSRGVYDADRPNPVLGLSSRDLARIAAEVYAANGVRTWMLADEDHGYVSTPELSFLIRELRAHGGLNISASHNHPDDNGGKFYNRHGGQEVPPHDERMSAFVEKVRTLKSMAYEQARLQEWVRTIPAEAREAYFTLNLSLSLRPDARAARVVFSPLHGTGKTTVGGVLERAGFDLELVSEQAEFDGRFPQVPFRIPNPEVPQALEAATALAREQKADLVLATDPDADRLGAAVPDSDGEWRFLTGNEIAALVLEYALRARKEAGRLSDRALVVKTEVTSRLLSRIARGYGAQVVGDLLVGFKYIGEVLRRVEETGAYEQSYQGSLDDFVMAAEESHGLLTTAALRDKDAAGGALYLAELAAAEKAAGRPLGETLKTLYRTYGYVCNQLSSLVMEGARGMTRIRRILEDLRQSPPSSVAGRAVERTVDRQDESGPDGPFLSETDRAARNVLSFELEGEARVILRPSGTEPKAKVYVEVAAEPLPATADDAAFERRKAETEATARAILDDFVRQALARVDVHLPDHARQVSDLVSIDNKLDFAERFLPELEVCVQEVLAGKRSEEDCHRFVDERLRTYGNDARALVAPGFEAYLQNLRGMLGARGDETLALMRRVFEAT